MTKRKKKLLTLQLVLFFFGALIIFFTYWDQNKQLNESNLSSEARKKINKELNNSNKIDIFHNVEYSGLDLAGNRYNLKSKEAYNDKEVQEKVNMSFVNGIFYFKDNTVLYVKSDKGVYNNKTLDIIFLGNVKADYEGSNLMSDKMKFSNSKSFLTITGNVKVIDKNGIISADQLLFDIKKQTLNIAAFDENNIEANVNLK